MRVEFMAAAMADTRNDCDYRPAGGFVNRSAEIGTFRLDVARRDALCHVTRFRTPCSAARSLRKHWLHSVRAGVRGSRGTVLVLRTCLRDERLTPPKLNGHTSAIMREF